MDTQIKIQRSQIKIQRYTDKDTEIHTYAPRAPTHTYMHTYTQELSPYLGPGWTVREKVVVSGAKICSEVLVAVKN